MRVLVRFNTIVGTVTDDYLAQDGEQLLPVPEGFDLDNWEYADGALRTAGMRLTQLAYMQRFSIAEEAGIRVAAKTNPVIEVILARLAAAEYVDLTDPATADGLSVMVNAGLLPIARAEEILGSPLPASSE